MRTLVVGAGALGGYFGAYLQQAGREPDLLVRPARAAQLARNGLRIANVGETFTVQPRALLAGDLQGPYDLVLVTVKSYALAEAMEHFAPAIGPATVILPVLNGILHLETLAARFPAAQVYGGMTVIGAAADADGHVTQIYPKVELVFGPRPGADTRRADAVLALLDIPGIAARLSTAVMQDMWDKFYGLCAFAAVCCLMRASVGEVLASPGGREMILATCAETRAVATASGFPPSQAFVERVIGMFTQPGSPIKPSMLRDIEHARPTEGAHVVGDMVARARRYAVPTPLLDLAWCHLATYEATRPKA